MNGSRTIPAVGVGHAPFRTRRLAHEDLVWAPGHFLTIAIAVGATCIPIVLHLTGQAMGIAACAGIAVSARPVRRSGAADLPDLRLSVAELRRRPGLAGDRQYRAIQRDPRLQFRVHRRRLGRRDGTVLARPARAMIVGFARIIDLTTAGWSWWGHISSSDWRQTRPGRSSTAQHRHADPVVPGLRLRRVSPPAVDDDPAPRCSPCSRSAMATSSCSHTMRCSAPINGDVYLNWRIKQDYEAGVWVKELHETGRVMRSYLDTLLVDFLNTPLLQHLELRFYRTARAQLPFHQLRLRVGRFLRDPVRDRALVVRSCLRCRCC